MRFAIRFLLLCVLVSGGWLQAQDDVVMKAMQDELARSMKQLHLENLDRPYFISYRVVDSDSTRVSASFDALTSSAQNRARRFTVEVRVGSYKLDNTNFTSLNFNMSSMVQVFNGNAQLPLDDNYKELRRQMWLATDATYKKAVEDLSKKKAALQNKTDADETPDFTMEPVVHRTVDAPVVNIDRAQWESAARSLSALFLPMPDIYTSTVSFSAVNSYVRYINSEGTSYTRREPSVTFAARASSQAGDGKPLENSVWLYARSPEGLPSMDQLAVRIHTLARQLTDLRTASQIETYNGPVLVEGDAAPQVFEAHFVPNLLGVRRPLVDSQIAAFLRSGPGENPFLDKIGARVLPDFLSVTDNPTLAEYHDVPLAGWCEVDEDGVVTRETKLVENGILETLLTTRDPVRGFTHSSGSRHAGQAAPSNLFVTAENGLSEADLRAKLLAIVKQRNKDYGIVVRRMRNGQQPLLAWKIFPDGHEELIHGVQFEGLNAEAFKDIVAASKDPNILTVSRSALAANGIAFFLGGVESGGEDVGSAPITLAVPSILFDDVTVHRIRGESNKPPILARPGLGGAAGAGQ